MSHNLYDKYTAVRRRRRMDAVNYIRRNVNGALETKGNVRSINIVINRLWQMNDIQPFFPQKICRFLRSVAA